MMYGAIIFLHVLGALILIGNAFPAAFWKMRAERSGNLEAIHRSAQGIMIADYWFTIPGTVLALGTGHFLMHSGGYSLLELSWLSVAYWLFVVTGVIWAAVLIPVQLAMIKHSRTSMQHGVLTEQYRRSSRIWDIFGTLSTLLPLVVLYLMLVKPF
jgi:uncharacterized membrane protein